MTNSVLYFGKLNNDQSYNCTILNLLLNNVIKLDGTIDVDALHTCRKKHLWMYIFYLAQSNPGLPPFIGFDKEDAVERVKNYLGDRLEYEYFLKKDLAMFINIFISTNGHSVNIKMLHQLLDKLIDKVKDYDRKLLEGIREVTEKYNL